MKIEKIITKDKLKIGFEMFNGELIKEILELKDGRKLMVTEAPNNEWTRIKNEFYSGRGRYNFYELKKRDDKITELYPCLMFATEYNPLSKAGDLK